MTSPNDRVPLVYRTTPELLERLQHYAEAHSISRNSAISVALTRELDRWEASQLVAHE